MWRRDLPEAVLVVNHTLILLAPLIPFAPGWGDVCSLESVDAIDPADLCNEPTVTLGGSSGGPVTTGSGIHTESYQNQYNAHKTENK